MIRRVVLGTRQRLLVPTTWYRVGNLGLFLTLLAITICKSQRPLVVKEARGSRNNPYDGINEKVGVTDYDFKGINTPEGCHATSAWLRHRSNEPGMMAPISVRRRLRGAKCHHVSFMRCQEAC